MPSLTLDVPHSGETAKRLREAVRDRVEFSKSQLQKRHEKWRKAEDAALAYLPEKTIDAKRRLLREQSGIPQYTTIVVPYSYGILMASHTYWSTVFLSRSPVFQFVGRHGEGELQAQAVESYINYQVGQGGMLIPLYIWLLDVGKYGQGAINNYWESEEISVSKIEEVEEMFMGIIPLGKKKKIKTTIRMPGYVGNKLLNVRPFDFFPDPRVSLHRFQDGEFCASYFEIGWNSALERVRQGFYIKATLDEYAKRGNAGGTGARIQGSSQLDIPGMTSTGSDFFQQFVVQKKPTDLLKGYECTINLVPKDWKLGSGEVPEKWVITVSEDYQFLLGAQPHGAFHNKFPYNVIVMEPEGYAITTRGLPEIIEPIQNTMDWLLNTHMYNVRKTLNNQFIVDPSRIQMNDITDNAVPGGAIRLKPGAYGTDVRTVLNQMQVADVTRTHLADMQMMDGIGQKALGINDQILGMIQPSSRRSATEVRSSNAYGINRLKTESEYFSAMGFMPLSEMLVQNSQQYYDMERKFRIVGDTAQGLGTSFVNVTPESIQGFYDLEAVDGTLPVDRLAQANLWRELLGQMRNFPQLMMEYDMGKIFGWVAKLSGLKNINQFKVQVVPDEMAMQGAQAGNIVPLRGMPPERDLGRVPAAGSTGGPNV